MKKSIELAVRFGFNSRFRAICYVFCKLFYGECKILSNLEDNKNIKGIGMSDSGWATIFEKKFDYVNTFIILHHIYIFIMMNILTHFHQFK